MKRLYILFFLLTVLSPLLFAQKVLLEKKTADLYTDFLKNGPNRLHYHHLYINWGLTGNKSEGNGCEVIPFNSNTFATGLRYKLRINNSFAIGYNLQFSLYSYHLKQDSLKKRIPNSIEHKKEKLRFNNVGAETYIRLNVGKRGNLIGRFLDVGFYVDRIVRGKHIYYDEVNANINKDRAEIVKTSNRKLNYITKFNYGIRSRIGLNRYILSIGYRFTDLFNNQFHNKIIDAELPRLYFSLEIGLHK